MKLVHFGAVSALALVSALTATTANAQGLRGIRAEAQVGYSQFHADGLKDSKIGYGAAGGVDFDLGGFVVGAEGTFWWAPAEVEGIDGAGFVNHKTFEEYGLALRAGVMASPSTLVYGKLGLVRNEQRKEFLPAVPGGGFGGPASPAYYYENYKVSGWQWGAGVEQMISNNIYAKVEGRYSDYKKKSSVPTGGSHTITGLVGLGFLFGAPVVEAPVVAAPVVVDTPPPPAPATQTCPDGSVILATDVCPAPPPPPPPPAPAPERG